MFHFAALSQSLAEHWNVWLVTITLVVAAVIDGYKLKVPNWLTFPMILGGWAFGIATLGWEGLGWSLVGTGVGLALLLPAYAIGGMGAGDVKLLAGVGAWMGGSITLHAFCCSAIIGGTLALVMVLSRGAWMRHRDLFWTILGELTTIHNPAELSAIAAQRKSTMMLLPYGIPIALGTIGYFAWSGLLG